LCEVNKAGAEVDLRALPISKSLHNYCNTHGKAPLDYAIKGGEDYALILSVDARKAEAVAARVRRSFRIPARVVGTFTSREGEYILLGEGRRRIRHLKPAGWDHLAGRL